MWSEKAKVLSQKSVGNTSLSCVFNDTDMLDSGLNQRELKRSCTKIIFQNVKSILNIQNLL